MDGQAFIEEVHERKRTELDRLGSDKALLAATGADLSTGAVLETVALSLEGLQATLAEWAEGASADPARDAFADAAASLAEDGKRVGRELDAEPAGAPPAPLPTVRRHERPVGRVAAAFVGHGLVFDGTLLQAVSFFVNEAERGRADLMRDLREATGDRVEDGAATLGTLCAEEGDWDDARHAADAVVDAAYDEYTGTLSGMGIDPKPVC
jgi:hypothetical protein